MKPNSLCKIQVNSSYVSPSYLLPKRKNKEIKNNCMELVVFSFFAIL